MKCPKCGSELEEGKLLCEKCGEEVKIVPEFDIELEDKMKETISSMLQNIAVEVQAEDKVTVESEYEFDDDIKDEISDYFPNEPIKLHRPKKAVIVLIAVLLTIVIAGIAFISVVRSRNNSFDYQYEKAVAYAGEGNYSEAVSYLERGLAIQPENLDARFLLAKYYDKNGQQHSTIALLNEILGLGTGYEKRDEVYDMLLGIYASQEDFAKMGEMLKSCDVPRIVSKYNKYAALKPEFNKKGGVYDELISISLTGNAQGFVYYTMDGTVPTRNSQVYETPILLESGEYTIKAMFVNMYGVESDIETQNYYINLATPKIPDINLDSGTYTEPCLIEAYHDENTKIYYTMDGTVPDKQSNRYMNPIEMPYGISNFSFVAINDKGLCSEVVNRTYQLEVQANFNPELALQVLKNNLWADGKLLNVEGNVPNKLGINQYRVQTVYKTEEGLFYIVYEEYMDTMGKVHDTNNIYAINVNTADLYKAYKVDEGKYNLRAFKD